MFILELCIIPLQGCGAKSITADSTETQETQAQIDDAYGKGLSFTYNDYADNVLSLSYNLKQNADGLRYPNRKEPWPTHLSRSVRREPTRTG